MRQNSGNFAVEVSTGLCQFKGRRHRRCWDPVEYQSGPAYGVV